jgi:phosphoserine phosphatase RsbU/P
LFDPFRRAERRQSHASGVGLGLFITKEIVQAHGGLVAVESSEPDGTTFRVVLPRTAS